MSYEQVESLDESFTRRISHWIWWYPVIWLVGLGGFWWVLIAAPSIVYLTSARRLSPYALVTLTVPIAILLSIPVGWATFGFSTERALSVIGNASVWVVLAACLNVQTSERMSRLLRQGLTVLGLVQGTAILLAKAAYPAPLGIPLLSPFAASLPGGASAFAEEKLYYMDWLGGAAFRSAGIMGNPTWSGAVAAVAILCAISLLNCGTRWRIISVLSILGSITAVQLSLSRSVTLSFGGAIILGLIFMTRKKSIPVFVISFVSALAIAISVAMIGWSDVAAKISEMNSERTASLTTRSAIYEATFSYIRELPIPLLGYGIKPQEERLVASIATHSTYLGLQFRGGAVALLAFITLIAMLAKAALSSGRMLPVTLVAFAAVWCSLEDFDTGHFLPFALVIALHAARAQPDLIETTLQSEAVLANE